MPILEMVGLVKAYGGQRAVDDVSLALEAGQALALLGPSGSGKSTLLALITGLETPDAGDVRWEGRSLQGVPTHERGFGLMFQDYVLFPHRDVGENVAFGLRHGQRLRRTRAQIERGVSEALALVGLAGFERRDVNTLSGGEQQRVALARALAPDPDLLLLDEPLGALDARLRAQVQLELKDIQRRTGKTFFFVTHDQDEALTMSDRIVVMNHGRVEQDGTPEDLYLRPKSRFVAEFIGETNLLSGPVRHAGNGRVDIDWSGMPVQGRSFDYTPRVGDEVTAALRLEKVGFYDRRPETGNAVRGRVVSRVFKGSRTAVDVRVGEAKSAILKAYVDRDVPDDVWLGWDAADLAVLQG